MDNSLRVVHQFFHNQSLIHSLRLSARSTSQRGFTIVELLIVVVIIGILAAIVVVAYGTINNRAKTSKAQSAAAAVIKKANAHANLSGSYPTTAVAITGFDITVPGSDKAASLQGSGITLAAISTAPSNENTVEYLPCTSPSGAGAQVSYWDYAATTPAKKSQIIGAACTTYGPTALSGGAY